MGLPTRASRWIVLIANRATSFDPRGVNCCRRRTYAGSLPSDLWILVKLDDPAHEDEPGPAFVNKREFRGDAWGSHRVPPQIVGARWDRFGRYVHEVGEICDKGESDVQKSVCIDHKV